MEDKKCAYFAKGKDGKLDLIIDGKVICSHTKEELMEIDRKRIEENKYTNA